MIYKKRKRIYIYIYVKVCECITMLPAGDKAKHWKRHDHSSKNEWSHRFVPAAGGKTNTINYGFASRSVGPEACAT